MLIYLVGFMGSGKTSVGKILAEATGYDFVDLDVKIEEKYRISVSGIFEKYGEPAFRILESKALEETFSLKNTVVSTGGGTPCFHEGMAKINAHGYSVYMVGSPALLAGRLSNKNKPRPLLEGFRTGEMTGYIESKIREREAYYNQAHLKVLVDDISSREVVHRIVEAIGQNIFL